MRKIASMADTRARLKRWILDRQKVEIKFFRLLAVSRYVKDVLETAKIAFSMTMSH